VGKKGLRAITHREEGGGLPLWLVCLVGKGSISVMLLLANSGLLIGMGSRQQSDVQGMGPGA
jgi:hypothetical protein